MAERIAVVVAGAGARGAYEAGALGALVPRMEEAGEHPTMLIGTSAGALNAALLAAFAGGAPPNVPDRFVGLTVSEVLEAFWRELTCEKVWRRLLTPKPAALQYVGRLKPWSLWDRTSLLDTTPLEATAAEWEWVLEAAREKIRAKEIEALAVATTDVYRSRTVVFVELAPGVKLPPTNPKRAIDYVATSLTPHHLVASAAIPLAFPAIDLPAGDGERRWYADGGVRLNAPLKPALELGATRLLVVATHPADQDPSGHDEPVEGTDTSRPPQPELDDQLVNVLEAVLVDRMVEDLRTLRKINDLVRRAPSVGRSGAGRPRRRDVRHVFVGPPSRATLGQHARDVYRKLGPRPWLRRDTQDLWLLRQLLASGEGPRSHDALSYLFFHPAFATAAHRLGVEDADGVMPAGTAEVPWQ
jgi:NTE family protein